MARLEATHTTIMPRGGAAAQEIYYQDAGARELIADLSRGVYGRMGALKGDASGKSISIATDWIKNTPIALKITGETAQDTAAQTITGIGKYDTRVTLDGSESWGGPGGSIGYFQVSLTVGGEIKQAAITSAGTGAADVELASWGEIGNAATTANRVYAYSNGAEQLTIRISLTSVTTKDALKALLAEKPLTIWYQSAEFLKAREVYIGVKAADVNGSRAIAAGPMKPLYAGDVLDMLNGTVTRVNDEMVLDGVNDAVEYASGAKRTVNAYGEMSTAPGICTHYTVTTGTVADKQIKRRANDAKVAIVDNDYATDAAGLAAYNAFLAAEYALGHPVKAIFERTEPLIEAVDISGALEFSGGVVLTAQGSMEITYSRDANDVINAGEMDFLRCFHKFVGIGDSLMAGFTQIDGTTESSARGVSTKNNWFDYLMARLGREGTNLAVGSSTTYNWRYGGQGSYPATNLPGADIDGVDCYFVGLGVNDLIKPDENPIGSAADIKADYTANGDTTYGNLDFILHRLAEYRPYAKVFVFTIPWYGSSDPTAINEAIRYVCSVNANAYCIDLAADGGFVGEFEKANYTGNHFNPLTYSRFSVKVERAVNRYIYAHSADFKWIPYEH